MYVGEVLPDGSAYVQDNPEIVGERYNQKAWVPEHTGGNGNGPGNIRLFRYAEVLLIAAEALNENGNTAQALTYLNMVRARARGGKAVLPDVTPDR
ncbi:MAG: RagB/SusD family nutrient uptake outer membrane protein [Lewinellaceae bacterium]|nr:RagB/SusD family nutrient uptake outer membrane protein [Lewinellaceae bacterium]